MLRTALSCSLALLLPALACAQDDPLLQAPQEAAPASTLTFDGEALLRIERTTNIPGARPSPDLDRERARVRVGVTWTPNAAVEVRGALKGALGSDSNRDNRINNDNERSNGAALDQLFVRWRPGESTSLLFGKSALPLELSPLVWDRDLRPAGVSIDHGLALGDFNRLQFTAGAFVGDHLYHDHSRIAAVQAAWRWHEGAPSSGAVLLGYLDFSHLDALARNGLGRTNLRDANGYVSDFRLLDLQLVGRHEFGDWPFEARLDLVRNLGADNDADAARFSIVAGDRRRARSWEFGFALQRQQRDAVLAAFTEDDWWFHSFAHGAMPWLGYGLTDSLSVRLAGFREQRDGVAEHTRRVVLDLEARW
ncbi:hypothetical protein [Dokdonella sp.]|uniref:hypothetical protein n=1 Tax=Dokdonella sp. TaxID=2291710 RepID=UPI00378380EC